MILGLGTDLVSVARIEAVASRQPRFPARILTPHELECYAGSSRPPAYLAKRFAAKEAIAKALGRGIGIAISWQDMEIRNDRHGKPQVRLSGGAMQVLGQLGGQRCHLSISDEGDIALAFAIVD